LKKIFLLTLLIASIFSFSEAKESDYMSKILKLWSLKTNKTIEFNATKIKDGYNIFISSKNPYYKDIFSNKPIKLIVDEGPFIFKPRFTLGTAGLVAKGSILDILNPKVTKEIQKDLKSKPLYSFEGIVSFSNQLESTLKLDPIIIEDRDFSFKTSKVIDKSSYDLNTFIGKESIKIDSLEIKPLKEEGFLRFSNILVNVNATSKPIDDIMLFVNNSIDINSLELNATNIKTKQKIHAKFSAKFGANTTRVDKNYLNVKINYLIKALDEPTLILTNGIKRSTLIAEFKNLGIKGVVDLIKLNQKMQEINSELMEATQKNDDIAIQKAILKSQEIANKIVPIWNETFEANKSRVILDLELESDKVSYIKLDLVYKAKPLSGNLQSALIALMAQGLEIFDGKFDIAIDSTLITSINPLAILGLDMLKSKGFVTFKNGIYYLKGELKNGKLIINGKAYNLKELSQAMF